MRTHRYCPVCASRNAELLHHQRFALPAEHPLPSRFDIVVCASCGFVFADTTGTASDYGRYYATCSKYADQQTSTGGGGNPKDQERLDATAADIAGEIPDKKACIVDIGCANGGLLGALKARGYTNLCGIDPSPDCVRNIGELFGIHAKQGWLGALPEIGSSADGVIISHVLEHVLYPLPALRSVAGILAPGGIVYAEVPDADRYVDCLAAPFQDFNTEHINHFSSATLGNLFSAAGFKCLTVSTRFLEAAPGIPYPVVSGFFQKEDVSRTRPEVEGRLWRRDEGFLAHLEDYIKKSREQLVAIDERLAPSLTGPVIVWGTGQLTLKLLAETCLAGAAIAAFVDGNPVNHGKRLQGVEIVSPEKLKTLPPYPIIIGSLLHHEAIRGRIVNELHLPNQLVMLASG